MDTLIVVDADQKVREQRLVRNRGMRPEDVLARVGAQARSDDLLRKADIVVQNSGTMEDLVAEADRVWADLQTRAA